MDACGFRHGDPSAEGTVVVSFEDMIQGVSCKKKVKTNAAFLAFSEKAGGL